MAIFRQFFEIYGYFPPNFRNIWLFSAKFLNFWLFSAKISKFLTIFCQNPETSVKIHATYYPTGTTGSRMGGRAGYQNPARKRIKIPPEGRSPKGGIFIFLRAGFKFPPKRRSLEGGNLGNPPDRPCGIQVPNSIIV